MGILDMVKGLFESDAVQGVVGSTPLSDVVDQVAPVGDAAALAEGVGIDAGPLTEVAPGLDQVTEVAPGLESLPPDVAALAEPVVDLGGADPPAA